VTPGCECNPYGMEGLSAQQIAMMGLSPEQDFRRPTVDPFAISARASYRNEMPSEANGGPTSMVGLCTLNPPGP
jgi:hypothetical protein